VIPTCVFEMKRYCDDPASYGALVFVTLAELLLDPTTLFNIALVGSCVLGLAWCDAFYSLVLMKVVTLSAPIANVVKAVFIPLKSLAMTFVLAIIFVFIFALCGFWVWRETVGTVDGANHCNSLLECFFLFLHMGFLGGAGIPGDGLLADEQFRYNEDGSVWKVLFDLMFWVIVTILLLNCVFGIMLDTFAALREKHDETYDQLTNYCFICCLHRSEFSSQTEFALHEQHEHNMLDYVSFIMYVECAKETARNGVQDYVHHMLEAGDISWLPVHKSMSLGKEGDVTTLDTVRDDVAYKTSNMEGKMDNIMQMLGDVQARLTSLELEAKTSSQAAALAQDKIAQ